MKATHQKIIKVTDQWAFEFTKDDLSLWVRARGSGLPDSATVAMMMAKELITGDKYSIQVEIVVNMDSPEGRRVIVQRTKEVGKTAPEEAKFPPR